MQIVTVFVLSKNTDFNYKIAEEMKIIRGAINKNRKPFKTNSLASRQPLNISRRGEGIIGV